MAEPVITPIIRDYYPDGHAAAAIIVTETKRFLLQHRDDRDDIWFPNFWGLFGGAIEAGEQPDAALRRELEEELGFAPRQLQYFSQIAFDLGFARLGVRLRYYFIAEILERDIESFTLQEGQNMALFDADEIRRHASITPYDSHGLLLYLNQATVEKARAFSGPVASKE